MKIQINEKVVQIIYKVILSLVKYSASNEFKENFHSKATTNFQLIFNCKC